MIKVTAKTPDICTRVALSDEAKKLPRDALAPRQYVDQLLAKGFELDAIRFLAQALPKREGVWWACQCARQVLPANPEPKITAALQSAEKWVNDPSEDNRRAAQKAAEAAELSNPAGCAAMAVFFSGGSLAPPNVPAVPPADHLTGEMVAGAVMLAAVQIDPAKAPERHKRFCALGIEVGNGTNKWK